MKYYVVSRPPTKRSWGYGTLKFGDVHKKFIFLEIQELRPLRTCHKHYETILPNFFRDECEI